MKCKNCGKGRPTFWNKFGGFCNEQCFQEWKEKQKIDVVEEMDRMEAEEELHGTSYERQPEEDHRK